MLEHRKVLAPMTFIVTDPSDSGGANTLRQAIINSNANDPGLGMFNVVVFNINSGVGPYSIHLLSALPALTNSVFIDGYSQSGSHWNTQTNGDNAILQIELDGSGAVGTNVDGLTIAANSCVVQGLAINRFTDAIRILPNVTGTRIRGDFIGSNVTGTAVSGNYAGVNIMDGATSNQIGGPNPALRNLISGNSYGIAIAGSNDQVQGNFIGIAIDGQRSLANGVGVFVGGGATASSGNTIGGITAGSGNVISGNTNYGVWIYGAKGNGNTVEGDYIGTTANGDKPLPNAAGVVISDGASSNYIGTALAGNTISGNSGTGIDIRSLGTIGNRVGNNNIGTDRTGTLPLGNTDGIRIESGASSNVVGDQYARNTISGNNSAGVMVAGGGTGLNVVHGNYIGCSTGDLAAVPNSVGVEISEASYNAIGGFLSGTSFGNFISGNSGYGVEITGIGASDNQVATNWIGLDYTGAAALPNGGDGVWIGGDASANTIGGFITLGSQTAPAGNVISANHGNGITIVDYSAHNVVQGNYIGTNTAGRNPSGVASVGNAGDGIYLTSVETIVGGPAAGAGNVVSGNGQNGIEVSGAGGADDLLQGNFIGTDAAGNQAIANSADGVLIGAGVQGVSIGGTVAAAGNVISGNYGSGIQINGNSASGTRTLQIVVQGNRIGTNAAGTSALGNNTGIFVNGGGNAVLSLITLGGTQAAAGNLVSGNGLGIEISGSGATGVQVQGNKVGTDVTGTAPLGNSTGVAVGDRAANNMIGGVVAGAGNTVAYNTWGGVEIGYSSGETTIGNSVLSNSIFSNGSQFPQAKSGIELAGAFVTNNGPGPHTGPNHLQNYPVLISAVEHADGSTTLRGLFNSTPNTNYRVEFFANPTADPSAFGQGQTFLDATGVTTDASGNASFTVTLGYLPVGTSITATATDLTTNIGDTSQFSNDIQVISHTPTVTSINPSEVVEGPFTLDIYGGSFAPDATASLNGTPLAITFVDSGHLHAAVPGSLAEEGADSITVSNPGPEGGTSSALPLVVSDAPLSASGQTIAATEAAVFSAVVASLNDSGGAEPASNYTAVVNWGDGSTSQARLVPAGSGFNVVASHSYQEEGTYPATTTIADDGGATATATSTVTIADGTLFAVSKTASFTEGTALARTVAAFEDADPKGAVADYSATVDWGDGQVTPGTITADGAIFDVSGLHQYATDGTFTITAVVRDAGGATTTVTSSAVVADSLAARPVNLNVIGNKTFGPATVATFTDPDNSKLAASDYTATITWDDGTTTSGTFFVQGSGTSGTFTVLGSHHVGTFAGYHTISVAITDLDDGSVTTVTDTVLDPPGLTPDQVYVLNAYQDAFGAAGNTSTIVAGASLSAWAAKLDAGASHALFATVLVHSSEYDGLLVGGLYQKYLGRATDADGLAYWVAKLQRGMTDEQLEAAFAGAPEFYQHAGGSDVGWVQAMYLDILNRSPDARGLAYWTGQLGRGADRAAVALGFAASPEREAQRVSDDYFANLGRAPDAAGLAYWVNAFENGMHNEDVIAGFLASDEYYLAHSS
jgi:hypothetical protein